jgi:hypothetical protein
MSNYPHIQGNSFSQVHKPHLYQPYKPVVSSETMKLLIKTPSYEKEKPDFLKVSQKFHLVILTENLGY